MNKNLRAPLALISSLLFMNCNTAPDEQAISTPPQIPALSTMVIPSLENPTGAKRAAAESVSGLNHGGAVLAIGFWTGVVAVNLAAPVILFEAARNAQPIRLPDSSGWQWVLSHGGHSALLTSRPMNGKYAWTMTVTGMGKSNFTWFTGLSSGDGKSGDWTFNDVADNQAEYRFTYALESATEVIKAEVVDADDKARGSYLMWKTAGHLKSFEGFDAEINQMTLIDWNAVTGAGMSRNLLTGNSYCWDTKYNGHADIPCK